MERELTEHGDERTRRQRCYTSYGLSVNNKPFETLPPIYREVVPQIVEHFTKELVSGEKGLKKMGNSTKGRPRKFRCQGLLMALEDQDFYCVPFPCSMTNPSSRSNPAGNAG